MSVNLPRRWLDKATEDLIVARLVLQEGHTAHACFLSQQCIEKSLKGYLVARTNDHPRVHKLVDLLDQCAAIEPSFTRFLNDCTRVDQYYIPTRYPDGVPGSLPEGMPSITQATQAIASAEQILRFVTEQLSPPASPESR